MHTRVEVAAPATTANLGPGFDCLALALDLWNTVTLEVGPRGVEVRGEGEGVLSLGPDTWSIERRTPSFARPGSPPRTSL